MVVSEIGYLVAGVDEAGRGPLAGPVFAAAVVLHPDREIEGLADSKALTPAQRKRLETEIREKAVCWAIGVATASEVDRLNVLRATFAAMRRAIRCLEPQPLICYVDGNRPIPNLAVAQEATIDGDATIPAVSAASILAKEWRDRYMVLLDKRYPGYGFARHKGYYCEEHITALLRLGPCPEHRRSFAPLSKTPLPLYPSEVELCRGSQA